MPPNTPGKPKKSGKKFKSPLADGWGPYKQLLRYVVPYRSRFIMGLVFGGMCGAVSGLLALVIKFVTSHVFPSAGQAAKASVPVSGFFGSVKHMVESALGFVEGLLPQGNDSVIWICSIIPAVMVLRSLFAYLNAYCMAWVSLKILSDIRSDLFKHIVGQSLEFFNKERAGNLISRVANDTRVAQQALTTVSSDLVIQPIQIVTAITALIALDWKFTVISLVLFPVCLIPIIVYGRKVRRGGRDEEAGVGAIMVILSESLAGIKLIKALAREGHESQKFRVASQAQFGNSIRVRKAMEIVGPIIEAVSAIGVGMALVYVYHTKISPAVFLGLLSGLFMLYDPVKKLSRVHVQIQKCLSSTTRIFDLMNQQPTIQDAPDAVELKDIRGAIEFQDVRFTYNADKLPAALRKFTLSIEPGKTYALVGASGAGKSTVLSLLLRFYEANRGLITIDGHDIRKVTQKSLRENIGIVTQDTFLFHDTIFENIRYGRFDATEEEVYAAASQAFAHEFILQQPKGYQTVIGDKGCLLSGGQQQRIAIARALLKNAPILLLDEATSALDSESEKEIQRALENLAANRTVIAIAHRLSTILNADQIVVMRRGRIREIGTHQELFEQSGLYRQLYDLQFQNQFESGASVEMGA